MATGGGKLPNFRTAHGAPPLGGELRSGAFPLKWSLFSLVSLSQGLEATLIWKVSDISPSHSQCRKSCRPALLVLSRVVVCILHGVSPPRVAAPYAPWGEQTWKIANVKAARGTNKACKYIWATDESNS